MIHFERKKNRNYPMICPQHKMPVSYNVKWDFSCYLGISAEVLTPGINTYKCQTEVLDAPLWDLLKVKKCMPCDSYSPLTSSLTTREKLTGVKGFMRTSHRDLGCLPEGETGISFPKLDACQAAETGKPDSSTF